MSQQQQLPFGTAEGAYAERKALLWVALRECGASPGLIRFCEWLFDATGGGIVAITATYRELATKPWLLNCSRSTLKRIVAEGVATGLVVAEETWDGVGRPTGSRYSISRARVRELITRTSGQPVPPKDEPVRVQNEPLPVQSEPLRVQNEPIKRGEADVATAVLIPGGETPRAQGPNDTNEPMKEAQASEPTPKKNQESLVSPRSAGVQCERTEPTDRRAADLDALRVGHAIAAVLPKPLTADQRRALRDRLKARIAERIDDPECHDSLPGRVADMVVWEGVDEAKVNKILDSLAYARKHNKILTKPGQWVNGAFKRLAREHGIAWGKADDG